MSRANDYARDGFVIVRGLFDAGLMREMSADADRVLHEYEYLKHTNNIRCRWQDNVLTGECQFDAFDPIIDLSPVAAKMFRDQRLVSLIDELYGEPSSPFKDKLIFKNPGAKGYALHQDWIAWERFPRSFLSVVVPLDSANLENGCTVVYTGYHRNGPLTETDGRYHELPAETVDERKAVPLILEPGDAAVFDGFTPHRSQANLLNQPRRQLYYSFVKQSDGVTREQHYTDFHEYLGKKYAQHGKTETYYL